MLDDFFGNFDFDDLATIKAHGPVFAAGDSPSINFEQLNLIGIVHLLDGAALVSGPNG